MQSAIRCELLTDFGQLEALASEWNRLWDSSPHPEIFATLAWARAWWQTFGGRLSLWALAVFRENRLIGLLPLIAEARTLRFLGSPHSDYNDLLCEPDAGVEVLEKAFGVLYDLQSRWDRCILENVSETSNIVTCLPQLSERLQSRIRLAFGCLCPTLILDDHRQGVIETILKKDSLRRHHNTLRKKGHLVFRHVVEREEIRLHLPTLFRQHIARRAMAGSESMFSREDERAFYYALVNELDPRTELRFSVLELDSSPIAYHLGFESHGKFLWYKPTFDVNLWKLSPGEVLIKYLFEYIAARGFREFDFTRGRENFKNRFSNQTKKNYTLYLFQAGLRGHLIRLWKQAEEYAKTQLDHESRAFRVLKFMVGVARRIRGSQRVQPYRHDAPPMGKNSLCRVCKRIVFARERVLVFSGEKKPQTFLDDNLTIQPGTLADLSILSVEHSLLREDGRLQETQNRLNSGDILYIARDGSNLFGLAWMGIRSVVTESEVGIDCRIDLGQPINLIYDFWMPQAIRGEQSYARVFRGMLSVECYDYRQTWVCCRGGDPALQRGIEKAGFLPRHIMTRTRVLNAFVWTWTKNGRDRSPATTPTMHHNCW